MAKTLIGDVIVPEIFVPYVIERTAELAAVVASGIIVPVDDLALNGLKGGTSIPMPFWQDLTGESEVLSESSDLTPGKIEAGQDVSVLNTRGRAWAVNDLARALSGDDPMKVIGDMVAAWWGRDFQRVMFKVLEGGFGAASMSGNVHDISGEAVDADARISADATIDAVQLLGDAKGKLTAFAMHSAVESYLAKLDLIEYIRESEASPRIPVYQGKQVVVDDSCPAAAGVYTTYIFGQGALGFGEGDAPVPVESDRDILAGDDVLVSRRHFVLHPRGIKWKGSPSGAAPTNTELATGTNWERVWENKNIRAVQFKHKIG